MPNASAIVGHGRNVLHPSEETDSLLVLPREKRRKRQLSEEIKGESVEGSPSCIDSLAGAEKEIYGSGRERKRRCPDTRLNVSAGRMMRAWTAIADVGVTPGFNPWQRDPSPLQTRGEESGEKGMRRLYRLLRLFKSSTPARTAERSSFPPTSSAARMGPDFLLESPALVAPLPRNQGMSSAGSAD